MISRSPFILALAFPATDIDSTVMQFDDFLRDRQAQPGTVSAGLPVHAEGSH